MQISKPLLGAAMVSLALFTTACSRHGDGVQRSATADPSAVVIGTPAAPPTGDPPGTTPIASNTTIITKKEETEQKPQEGDNHSYSSVAQDNPQKAQGKDPQQTPDRKKDSQ